MIEKAKDQGSEDSGLPEYVKPTLQVLDEKEILVAFQMTAAKISAAGCWWGSCPNGS